MNSLICVSGNYGYADLSPIGYHGTATGWKCTIFADDISTITSSSRYMERLTFDRYLSLWENETAVLSAGQFDNANYKAIVRMGEEAVPYIADVISREPSPIVYALAEICGDKIPYRPFMSLKRLCRLWLKTLKREGRI